MDVKIFLCLLVSMVVGPKVRSPVNDDKRTIVAILMGRIHDFLKPVVNEAIKCSLVNWVRLISVCDYNLWRKPSHGQACEFLKAHYCLLGQEMTRQCDSFKNEQGIMKQLNSIQEVDATHANVDTEFNEVHGVPVESSSQVYVPVSVCLPASEQDEIEMQQPQWHGQVKSVPVNENFRELKLRVAGIDAMNEYRGKVLDRIAELTKEFANYKKELQNIKHSLGKDGEKLVQKIEKAYVENDSASHSSDYTRQIAMRGRERELGHTSKSL